MPDTLAFPTAHARMGSNSGQPLTRRDGVLKVTGTATYAADNHPAGHAHAVIAVSSIARGRVTSLDVAAAMAHPGVIEVITPANCPPLALDPDQKHGLFGFRFEALQNDRVRYAKQPIAVVVAETLEAATEGARLLAPTYEVEPARIGFDDGEHYDPPAVGIGAPPSFAKGDLAAGHAAATRSVDTTYRDAGPVPQRHGAACHGRRMGRRPPDDRQPEPGDRHVARTVCRLFRHPARERAAAQPLPRRRLRLQGDHERARTSSTILAARMLQRPVKLVLSRDQMFGPVGHRGATQQHLRLGMDAEGRLTALEHNAVSTTSSFDDFIEPAANASHNIYASPAISTRHGAVRIDTGTPGPMRAPGEASGSAALECAIDEAALACGLDPLEFRLRNYAETDPATGKTLLVQGAARMLCRGREGVRLGRPSTGAAPDAATMKAGSSAGAWALPCSRARCSLPRPAPRCAATEPRLSRPPAADMGQGAWTALAQIAADGLGLEVERVEFRSGISDLPDAGVAGGSGHTASAGTALHNAGTEAIAKLTEIATADPASPLFGAGNAGVEARDGRLYHRGDETRSESYAEIMARAGMASLEGNGTGTRDPKDAEELAMYSHGAVFAEVKVDPDLCQVLVTRLVGAFAAGRVINPRLARSQLYGGMIWGVSFALHEEAVHDRRTGRPMNADLAGYHVPVQCRHSGHAGAAGRGG